MLGEEHPDVATSLNNLAMLYQSQGQYDKASPLYQQSLPILMKVLGEEHPDVAQSLNNLAESYRSQGQYDKALPLSQQSLAIIEKMLGKEHPNTKTIAENLRNIQRHLVSPVPFQIVVKKVSPDSRAEQLGIQVGDILTHYAGQPIRGVESFIYGRSQEPTGGEVKKLQVLRGDKGLKFMLSPGGLGVELREEEKAINQIK